MSNVVASGGNRSQGEIEALEVAEDSREQDWERPSFLADLFMGKFDFSSISPFPLQPEEDRKRGDDYIETIRPFFEKEYDPSRVDREEQIPDEHMKKMADLGLFGIKIPKKYGGVGLSQTNYDRILAYTSTICNSATALLSAHQSIGVPQPLLMFGTDAQKEKFLPDIARGAVSAFALTEPEVGSDPARMSTTATPTEDGEHYVIEGQKLWCTNGVIAKYIVVMALTPPKMVNGREKKQITALIVDTSDPGFEIQHRCRFMGLNGVQNGLLKFNQVRVPKENIIWGLGKGLRLALITLNTGRLSLPAACIGGLRSGMKMARIWGNERQQWGAVIGRHQAGAHKLARMSANLLAIESMTWLACGWTDRKSHDIRLEAAMAKVFASVRSFEMLESLVQFRGGRGYERGESIDERGEPHPFPVERMYRDSRINQIVEGTTEIMSLFIAREALDRHLKIGGDVINPKAPILKRLLGLFRAGAFYTLWYPRQWISLTIWPLYSGIGKNAHHMRFVARQSRKLARTVFHLMLRHGPQLERKQLQLMRLVNIATELFSMASTISYASALKGRSEYAHIEAIADTYCREAKGRIRNLYGEIWHADDRQHDQLAKKILDGAQTWQEDLV